VLVPCGGIRAASLLLNPASAGEAKAAAPAVRRTSVEDARTPDLRRPAAAGMLALASLWLAGAAAVWRRRRISVDETSATDPPEAAPEDDEAPRLTLVGLPREHGS
jgi:hypothetical protein